jgi:bleomycin hydrolase
VDALYTVSRLGNVVGGDPVLYVNAEISVLKQAAIDMIKADLPVFFGCDVGRASEAKVLGVLDPALYDVRHTLLSLFHISVL